MHITSKLITVSIFILFVVVIIFDSNTRSEDNCKTIFKTRYAGCVINKHKDLSNHGHVDIYLQELINNKTIILDPGSTGKRLLLYEKVTRGDTIIKNASSGIFYILNGAKRDSIVFSCRD